MIIGPMFAGKTSELIRRVKVAGFARKKVLLVKHSNDTRWSSTNTVMTHSGISLQTTITASHLKQVVAIIDNAEGVYDVVAVDEGQFFPDLLVEAESLANRGLEILIAGLDSNFLNHPHSRCFHQMVDLVARYFIRLFST